jgi:PIN domain nuclease of toxin-antitoxin system
MSVLPQTRSKIGVHLYFRDNPMEQALLDQIQRLPESVQQEALHYIEGLVAKHNLSEIAIKLNIGKLKIEHSIEDIYQLLAQLKIKILPIERLDLDRYLTLPLHHLRSFRQAHYFSSDRELILMTADASFEPYPVQGASHFLFTALPVITRYTY